MGNNCTCNDRFRKKEREHSSDPNNKSTKNRRPMFFEDVSFDIKHSEDFHAFKDARESNSNTGNKAASTPGKRNKRLGKHKTQLSYQCNKDFEEIHKILKARKVSKKELVEYVITDVKQEYIRKNKSDQNTNNIQEYTSTEGWLFNGQKAK